MEQPITPQHLLVSQWRIQAPVARDGGATREQWIATEAARWGDDQRLEACCEWVSQWCGRWPDGTRPEDELRAAMRPKPPSLKEQALAALDRQLTLADLKNLKPNAMTDAQTIRRALEAMSDD